MEWYKFAIAFVITVVLPVWVFNFIPISFFYKIAFTLAGAIGVWIALEYGSMRGR